MIDELKELCEDEPYSLMYLLQAQKGHRNDIDVFLGLLIDELKELCEDEIFTYNTSIIENFKIRASVVDY